MNTTPHGGAVRRYMNPHAWKCPSPTLHGRNTLRFMASSTEGFLTGDGVVTGGRPRRPAVQQRPMKSDEELSRFRPPSWIGDGANLCPSVQGSPWVANEASMPIDKKVHGGGIGFSFPAPIRGEVRACFLFLSLLVSVCGAWLTFL
jgi:hypothetical protein